MLPELVFGGMSRALHNQRALYLKRLLLFEPGVILASVPYRLDGSPERPRSAGHLASAPPLRLARAQ